MDPKKSLKNKEKKLEKSFEKKEAELEEKIEKREELLQQKSEKLEQKIEEKEKELDKQLKVAKKLQSQFTKEAGEFRKQFVERALKLVTSGFGLVSALAWNELIKEAVNVYIKPYFGENSGLISLAIYALLVTALAVMVTYQLSKFGGKEED